MLANNGDWLAKCTLALREIINQANSQVIAITMSGVKLDELYQQANGNIALQGMISNAMRACQSMTGEAQTFVDSYKSQFGDASWLDNIQGFLDGIGSAITGGGIDMGVFGLLKPLWMPVVVSVLYWLQIAYQNLLEAALLITALLGSIAVGGSLLPYGPKSVFAWLTGFFSVGFARLCFNIIVGLASVVATSSEGGDPFWFALFAGLLAPILASSLASGAGLTVWTSIANAVGKTATTIGGLMV